MSWSINTVGKKDNVKADVAKLGEGDASLDALRAFLGGECDKFEPTEDAYNNALHIEGYGHADKSGVSSTLTIKTVHLAGLLLLACLLAGCVHQNPEWTGPNTNGVPQFTADLGRINSVSNEVNAVTSALKPVNPYAGITDYVVNGAFGLTALLSGLWARHKSQVSDTLATGVVKAGPAAVKAVLDHASNGPKFAAVADAINDNTGANQSPTG